MRRIPSEAILLSFGLLSAFSLVANAETVSLAEKLQILKDSYPPLILEIRKNAIVLNGGKTLVVDDGAIKDHQAKLSQADIEDSLSQIYPLGSCYTGRPKQDFDPGRIRHYEFLQLLFGRNEAEVKENLRPIRWFRSRLLVTHRHGVDIALEHVRDDLEQLPMTYRKYFERPSGIFNWRVIAGTKRLSVHSFGAAIDIDTRFADYWRWAGGKPGNVPNYKNKIPREVIEIFERHGFIWGGKWYHFDTMHFEYRPELISIGRMAESRGCEN